MASNAFGQIFKITTWGESHGKAIGVVIDGCPAGLELSVEEVDLALAKRAPGKNPYTSPRGESDRAEILSGLYEGRTTGAPISIMIPNQDVDSSKYEPIKELFRPGHANFTYLEKYGLFDYRGGGRASARETAARVAAGAVAKKLIAHFGVKVSAYIAQIGDIKAKTPLGTPEEVIRRVEASPIFCPDGEKEGEMKALIETAKSEGDSLGGVIEFIAWSLPAGLGDPIYEKLEASLAKAMLSMPASKGFELGSGFGSVEMKGSEHNDRFTREGNEIKTETNYAGGTLGGISTGMPLLGKVAFKPTSSIKLAQKTVTLRVKQPRFSCRRDPAMTPASQFAPRLWWRPCWPLCSPMHSY